MSYQAHDARRTTHDARPTTHDARPTTHDPRRTTHDARPTHPRQLVNLQFLISIGLIFTMYQEIINYNLHRNYFKEFLHLVDFRGRRDAKREPCKSISTPGGIECFKKSFDLSSSTRSCQYPLQASRDMRLFAPDNRLATSSTVPLDSVVS